MKKTLEFFDFLIFSLAKISIVLIVFTIAIDASGRYLFNSPIIGAYEFVNNYLMISMTFFSISYVWKLDGHIGMTALSEKFPWFMKKIANIIGILASFILFGLIAYRGGVATYESWLNGYTSQGVVPWPVYLSYVFIPVGGGVLCIRLIFEFIENISSIYRKWASRSHKI